MHKQLKNTCSIFSNHVLITHEFVPFSQATAEQMRIAQIVSDSSNADDIEFRKKVNQVVIK